MDSLQCSDGDWQGGYSTPAVNRGALREGPSCLHFAGPATDDTQYHLQQQLLT